MKNKNKYLNNPFLYLLLIFLVLSAINNIATREVGQTGVVKTTQSNDWTKISVAPFSAIDPCLLISVYCEGEKTNIILYDQTITAFNTIVAQTDDSPCVAAGGYICGRSDVVACPRRFSLGTNVSIDGDIYVCLDRLALKFDNRWDISFDKDIKRARNFGKQIKDVTILE